MTTIGTSPTDSQFSTVGLLAAIGLTGLVLLLPTPEGLPPEAPIRWRRSSRACSSSGPPQR